MIFVISLIVTLFDYFLGGQGSEIGAEDVKNDHYLKYHHMTNHLPKIQLVGPNGRRLINYDFLYHISLFFSFAFEFWSQKRMSENGGGSGYFKNHKFFEILFVSSGIIKNIKIYINYE